MSVTVPCFGSTFEPVMARVSVCRRVPATTRRQALIVLQTVNLAGLEALGRHRRVDHEFHGIHRAARDRNEARLEEILHVLAERRVLHVIALLGGARAERGDDLGISAQAGGHRLHHAAVEARMGVAMKLTCLPLLLYEVNGPKSGVLPVLDGRDWHEVFILRLVRFVMIAVQFETAAVLEE